MTMTRSEVGFMYENSKGTITDAYANPSATKREIWKDLCNEVAEVGGHNLVVKSRNCHMFTAMYMTENQLVIIYPTRRERYTII